MCLFSAIDIHVSYDSHDLIVFIIMSYQPLAPQQEGQPIMQAYAQPSVAATAPQASYAPPAAAPAPAGYGSYQSAPQPVQPVV